MLNPFKDCRKCSLGLENVGSCGNRGPEDARVVLVGEAPGNEEVFQNVPFVGQAGQLLDKLLLEVDLDSSDFLITNACHCRGQNNRTPTADDVRTCRESFLKGDISKHPRDLIVGIGNCGMFGVIPKGSLSGITRKNGAFFFTEEFNTWVLGMIHPAATFRNPAYLGQVKVAVNQIQSFLTNKKPIVETTDVKVITTREEVTALIQALSNTRVFSFDLETTSICFWNGQVLCFSFSMKKNEAFVLPTPYYRRSDSLIGSDWPITDARLVINDAPRDPSTLDPIFTPLEFMLILKDLKRIFENPKILKVAQNATFDASYLKYHYDITVRGLACDTMLAHHLIDENSPHNLKSMANMYTGLGAYDTILDEEFSRIKRRRDLTSDTKHYGLIDPELLFQYSGTDADATLQLSGIFTRKLREEKLTRLFTTLVIPLQQRLMEMELLGVLVDSDRLNLYKNSWGSELLIQESEISNLSGYEVNPRSPLQLQKLLFQTLSFPLEHETYPWYPNPFPRTDTGQLSTDETVLLALSKLENGEIPGKILTYKKMQKLHSTYVIGVEKRICPIDKRVHARYLQIGTVTGRLSVSEPNLQNIPRSSEDNELAGLIKNLFISPEGKSLIEIDYRQIEVRVWAHASNDEKLIKLVSELDVHSAIASEVYGVPIAKVTPAQRASAKNCTFGLMYGRGAYSLAQEFNMTVEQAEEFIKGFFARAPKAKLWLDQQVQLAHERGYVVSPLGRKRRLPDIQSSVASVRAQAERQALNAPIQAGAVDLTNFNGIIQSSLLLEGQGLKTVPMIQIHDSVVFEAPDEELEETLPLLRKILETPPRGFRVPIPVEIKVGKRWGELEEWK